MKMKNKQKNNGFTLIELMVATSLFVVIMVTALSSLFMLLDESKNSRALRFAMDNVNFAMESMSRSIRMGTEYYCGTYGSVSLIDNNTSDCPNGGNLIVFTPQDTSSTYRVGYQLKDGTVERYDQNNSNGVPIVSLDVKVDVLKFFVNGSSPSPIDNIQPSVYIIMKGTVMVKGVPTSFAVQTMASQRNY